MTLTLLAQLSHQIVPPVYSRPPWPSTAVLILANGVSFLHTKQIEGLGIGKVICKVSPFIGTCSNFADCAVLSTMTNCAFVGITIGGALDGALVGLLIVEPS